MGTVPATATVTQEKLFSALMENVRYTASECNIPMLQVIHVLEQLAEVEEPTSPAKNVAPPTGTTTRAPRQATGSEEEDEVILFGKHKGTLFSKLIDKDVDYVKWILCNAEKSTYPQMKALVKFMQQRVEIYKPARSGPTMLMDKKTGIVISGALKGYPIPAEREETKKADLSARVQADPEYQRAVAQHRQKFA